MPEGVTTDARSNGAYVGRFAPSPSGPLHFGSIVTALASYLDARSCGGRWHVRIDDLDQPRTVQGADALILSELERLGLHWDGPVYYQRARHERYRWALDTLNARGLTFDCGCTRKALPPGPYPGTCRAGLTDGQSARSVRIAVDSVPVCFADAIQGQVSIDLGATVGDFIVRRADGLPAYHIAAMVDDHDLGATHVVRGADLLPSSGAQAYLYEKLGFVVPRYAHIPLAVAASGIKLSKASRAPPTSARPAQDVLRDALRFLGQPALAPFSVDATVESILTEAVRRWSLISVPPISVQPANEGP